MSHRTTKPCARAGCPGRIGKKHHTHCHAICKNVDQTFQTLEPKITNPQTSPRELELLGKQWDILGQIELYVNDYNNEYAKYVADNRAAKRTYSGSGRA